MRFGGVPQVLDDWTIPLNQYSFNQIPIACLKASLPDWKNWKVKQEAFLHFERLFDETLISDPNSNSANKTSTLGVHQRLGRSFIQLYGEHSRQVLSMVCKCECDQHWIYADYLKEPYI
jgi:hypothetical protein